MINTFSHKFQTTTLCTLLTFGLCVAPGLSKELILPFNPIPTTGQTNNGDWGEAPDNEWPTEEQPLMKNDVT